MAENAILKKLYLKPGYRAIILNAPPSYGAVIADIPPTVTVAETLTGEFDFIQVFVVKRADLEAAAHSLAAALKPDGLLWATYPKAKALGTDLKRETVWEALQPAGLRPVAQVAIDDTWSALRFKHDGGP
ncbi:MAG: hypothetical protein U0641_04855 [Anaerolineae bacterium]